MASIRKSEFAGWCPACHRAVSFDEPDGPVWTCPADLSETNPDRQEPHPLITDELRKAAGVYSNCGDDFGLPCYDFLPLHSSCYDGGNY